MGITLDLLDADGTFIKTLSNVQGRGWTKQLNDFGAGAVAMLNDHPDFASFTKRRMIRCKLDGTADFTWMLTNRRTVRLAEDPAEQVTVWTGLGAGAKLGTGRIGGTVVVAPDGRELTIGWVSPDWDVTGVPEPANQGYVVDSMPDGTDFPDKLAQWVGSSLASGEPTYARRKMLITSRPFLEGTQVRGFFVAKGAWTAWWDGVQVASGEPYEVVSVDLGALGATSHVVAIESARGSVGFTLVKLDDDGNQTGVCYRSFTQAVYGTGSPEPWVGWFNGTSPEAVTATMACDAVLGPGQTRGTADGVTTNWTDTTDSDGQPLTVGLPVVSLVDSDLLGDLLVEWTQTFSVDWRMAPDLELELYDDLGTDLSGSIVLTDASADGRIGRAELDADLGGPNVVRLSTSGGAGWTPSASGVPSGEPERVEMGAAYGTASSTAEVSNASSEVIDEAREPIRQTFETVGPAGYRPCVDYDVGDHIGIRERDGGSYASARVVAIQVLDQDVDQPRFSVTVERRL